MSDDDDQDEVPPGEADPKLVELFFRRSTPVMDQITRWNEQIAVGDAAMEALATYYDNLTSDEIEEMFKDAEPVEVEVSRSLKIGTWYRTRFEHEELLRIRRAAVRRNKTIGETIHDLTMRQIRFVESMDDEA